MEARTLEHAMGLVTLTPKDGGRWHVRVKPHDPQYYSPRLEIETSYGPALVGRMLELKSLFYLVDEIARDEDPGYTAGTLLPDVFAYVGREELAGKTMVDFGCGMGASTAILGRTFPESRVIGVELNQDFLEIARLRAEHHQLTNVTILRSPSPDSLPPEVQDVDVIVMSAVYEHMLPDERKPMLALLWKRLRTGGVLLLDQTPHRWFPIDAHTTHLPLINYLPDRLACWYALKCSPLCKLHPDWKTLLRDGIRGATTGEILANLREAGGGAPELMRPHRDGMHDLIDVWFRGTTLHNWPRGRSYVRSAAKALRYITGIEMPPYLALGIRKR